MIGIWKTNKKWLCVLLFLGGLGLPAAASGQAANPCNLPPGLFASRKAADPLSDTQRAIDRKYVEFMKAVAQLGAENKTGKLNACCDGVKVDVIAFQFCALIRYIDGGKKKPGPFLAAMPQTVEQREAFWFMEMISAGGKSEALTSLPGIALPDGLVFKFVDKIFDLMKKGNATAAERYLFLLDDASGEFGEYMDDQLPKLFLRYPQEVLTLWPVFQRHRKRLEVTKGFIGDQAGKEIAAKYEALCKSGDNRCDEIRSIFSPH